MEKTNKDEYRPYEEFPRKYIEGPEESHEDDCECLKEKTTDILKQVGWVIGKATISSGICVVALSLLPFYLGFTTRGVAAKSLAADYQRRFLRGTIVKGSLFSVMQRVGLKGFATSTKVKFGAVVFIINIAYFILSKKYKNGSQSSYIKGNTKKCTKCKRSELKTKKII